MMVSLNRGDIKIFCFNTCCIVARLVRNIPRTDRVTSTSNIINELGWDSLQARRERRRLAMFRAMHFREIATDIHHFLSPIKTKDYLRRHGQQYHIPHCNTKAHMGSFFIATAKRWNGLSHDNRFLCAPVVD